MILKKEISLSFIDFLVLFPRFYIEILYFLFFFSSLRTYAISKLSMWETFAYCSSRMCKFNDACVRMALTDTDSIYTVCESFRSELMHTEVHTLQHSPIDYPKSLHAYTMATAYMKTFGPILDFSSLKPKVNTKKKAFCISIFYI